ncbi:MAG: hypothetical protein ACLRYY_03270 [Anaerobutyricum soehngenii]
MGQMGRDEGRGVLHDAASAILSMMTLNGDCQLSFDMINAPLCLALSLDFLLVKERENNLLDDISSEQAVVF